MKSIFTSLSFLALFSSAAFAQGQTKPQEIPSLCTADAQLACVTTENIGPQIVTLGRLGPNCEFGRLPAQVPGWECENNTPILDPVVCTLDSKVLCVKVGDSDTYESISVGRNGPNCDFVRFDSEVNPSLCEGK